MRTPSRGRSPPVDDLIPITVGHLSRDSTPKELATLALVSSSWIIPVRRVLYARVRIVSYHSCYLLSRTLAESPDLGNRIHELYLHPVSRMCLSDRSCPCRRVDTFDLSLAPLFCLQRVSDISLGGEFAIQAEQYLRSFTDSRAVRRLRLEGVQWCWSFGDSVIRDPSLRWTEGLATRFTDLKELELVNLDLHISDPVAFVARPPQLERLTMDRVRIKNGKLSMLANGFWGNLRELTLIVSETSPEYDVNNVLLQASLSLTVFKYFVKEDDGLCDLGMGVGVDALASCASIRDLQLSVAFGLPMLKTLGTRLNKLVTLKVYCNYEIGAEDWSAELSNGLFPSLQELYLPVGYELRRLADWQWPALSVGTIRKVCTSRGILLSYVYLAELR